MIVCGIVILCLGIKLWPGYCFSFGNELWHMMIWLYFKLTRDGFRWLFFIVDLTIFRMKYNFEMEDRVVIWTSGKKITCLSSRSWGWMTDAFNPDLESVRHTCILVTPFAWRTMDRKGSVLVLCLLSLLLSVHPFLPGIEAHYFGMWSYKNFF